MARVRRLCRGQEGEERQQGRDHLNTMHPQNSRRSKSSVGYPKHLAISQPCGGALSVVQVLLKKRRAVSLRHDITGRLSNPVVFLPFFFSRFVFLQEFYRSFEQQYSSIKVQIDLIRLDALTSLTLTLHPVWFVPAFEYDIPKAFFRILHFAPLLYGSPDANSMRALSL